MHHGARNYDDEIGAFSPNMVDALNNVKVNAQISGQKDLYNQTKNVDMFVNSALDFN